MRQGPGQGRGGLALAQIILLLGLAGVISCAHQPHRAKGGELTALAQVPGEPAVEHAGGMEDTLTGDGEGEDVGEPGIVKHEGEGEDLLEGEQGVVAGCEEGDGDGAISQDSDTREQEEPEAEIPWTDEEIRELLETNPEALGCMSLGKTNGGAVFNGVQMPRDEKWVVLRPDKAWGTTETIDYLRAAIYKVHEEYPGTCPITIGNLSTPNGGRLGRHLSHQAGRDVDLGWYHKGNDCTGYRVATAGNLDLAKTWALVKALVTETDLKMMFIDRSIQRLLHAHALEAGEDGDWLNRIFEYPSRNKGALVRHARGHRDHIHVRFYNPEAQEIGRRAYPVMIEKKMIEPPTYYIYHRVRPGQTLSHLASRYNVSVRAIQRANGLNSTLIRAGYRYRIPKKGGVGPVEPVVVPPRRLPPEPQGGDSGLDTVAIIF